MILDEQPPFIWPNDWMSNECHFLGFYREKNKAQIYSVSADLHLPVQRTSVALWHDRKYNMKNTTGLLFSEMICFYHVKPNSSSLRWPFWISNHNDRSLQCDKCRRWRRPPAPPPPPPPPVCWDDEVRTDPRAWLVSSCLRARVFVAQLYGFVLGLNLWNSCASFPEWELCMSYCHLANSPSLLLCFHSTSCGHKGLGLLEESNEAAHSYLFSELYPPSRAGVGPCIIHQPGFAEVKLREDHWGLCTLILMCSLVCFFGILKDNKGLFSSSPLCNSLLKGPSPHAAGQWRRSVTLNCWEHQSGIK